MSLRAFKRKSKNFLNRSRTNIPKLDISGLDIEIPVKTLGMCMPFISLEENESGSDTNNNNSCKA